MTSTLSPAYRRYALGFFPAVNLLNYIDRQVLYAAFSLSKCSRQVVAGLVAAEPAHPDPGKRFTLTYSFLRL